MLYFHVRSIKVLLVSFLFYNLLSVHLSLHLLISPCVWMSVYACMDSYLYSFCQHEFSFAIFILCSPLPFSPSSPSSSLPSSLPPFFSPSPSLLPSLILHTTVASRVGLEQPSYTTFEGAGSVELCCVIVTPGFPVTPQFTLRVSTHDGSAGEYLHC